MGNACCACAGHSARTENYKDRYSVSNERYGVMPGDTLERGTVPTSNKTSTKAKNKSSKTKAGLQNTAFVATSTNDKSSDETSVNEVLIPLLASPSAPSKDGADSEEKLLSERTLDIAGEFVCQLIMKPEEESYHTQDALIPEKVNSSIQVDKPSVSEPEDTPSSDQMKSSDTTKTDVQDALIPEKVNSSIQVDKSSVSEPKDTPSSDQMKSSDTTHTDVSQVDAVKACNTDVLNNQAQILGNESSQNNVENVGRIDKEDIDLLKSLHGKNAEDLVLTSTPTVKDENQSVEEIITPATDSVTESVLSEPPKYLERTCSETEVIEAVVEDSTVKEKISDATCTPKENNSSIEDFERIVDEIDSVVQKLMDEDQLENKDQPTASGADAEHETSSPSASTVVENIAENTLVEETPCDLINLTEEEKSVENKVLKCASEELVCALKEKGLLSGEIVSTEENATPESKDKADNVPAPSSNSCIDASNICINNDCINEETNTEVEDNNCGVQEGSQLRKSDSVTKPNLHWGHLIGPAGFLNQENDPAALVEKANDIAARLRRLPCYLHNNLDDAGLTPLCSQGGTTFITQQAADSSISEDNFALANVTADSNTISGNGLNTTDYFDPLEDSISDGNLVIDESYNSQDDSGIQS